MRVLVVTKIFPNAQDPHAAPYNRHQFAALGRIAEVEVLATVPWFPGAVALRRWSAAGRQGAVPAAEVIDGLPVRHPRVLYLPKLAALSGGLYAASLWPLVARRYRHVDVVLGSWAYPDGCAAILLAARLGVPSVVKLHGSDVNVLGRRLGPRANLRLMLPRAERVVAVSRPLAEAVAGLGVARERIAVVPNGLDGELFRPRERLAARQELGVASDGKLLLYVGRLEQAKGLFDLLAAFRLLAPRRPEARLVLVGDGAARGEVEREAALLDGRVTLTGTLSPSEVARWIAAADLVTLPSWAEGMPNAVLEALASGRPVVATRVGGLPEVITSPTLGQLVPPRDPPALAAALEQVGDSASPPEAIAAAAGRGSWSESAAHLHQVLAAAIAEHRHRR